MAKIYSGNKPRGVLETVTGQGHEKRCLPLCKGMRAEFSESSARLLFLRHREEYVGAAYIARSIFDAEHENVRSGL